MRHLPLSQKKPDSLKGKFFRYIHNYSGAPVIKTRLKNAAFNLHVHVGLLIR